MTIESNEDGFNEEDIWAICVIHHSSKRQKGGYVGHKGIGFKSVFKIAYKVHIQPGPFSFSLERREGGSGMGMVTPTIQPYDDLLTPFAERYLGFGICIFYMQAPYKR